MEKFKIPTKEQFNERYLELNPKADKRNIDDLFDYCKNNEWKAGGKRPMKSLDAYIRKYIRRTY